ncbi:MAG: LysE family translocator [Bacteroidales bacterium]|jgi:threonine/homoserine/homoserine lactone efflux protein|nr:LysE family translocator [Bacteroidales bacterium]
MINYLIIGISYAFACVVQPGPFQAFLFSQSLLNGWRKTVPLVFAPLITDGPIIALVLFSLTKLPPIILQVLQCAGGVLLIYLALKGYKTWKTFHSRKEPAITGQQNLFKAVMVNFLNPAPYIGWSLVMGPLLIKSWNISPVNGITFLTGFYSSMIIFSIGMVMLFAATRSLGTKVNRILIGVSAVVLFLFGIYQLLTGILA